MWRDSFIYVWRDSSICVTCFIHIHRKSSLYLPLGSVNLLLKAMGTPDEISSPPRWNRVSPGCPRNFNTKLTEPTRQIKTNFSMNMCNVLHSYVFVMWLIHTCVTWLIHVCDVTHSYVCDVTQSCVCGMTSFMYVTWHIHMCGMTHSYV